MSFGTSAGDAILLVQLAWKTLQGARQACGEHDELTREPSQGPPATSTRIRKSRLLLARADDDRRQEISELCSGCEHVLKVMDSIITKYNALPEEKRSGRRLWQKIRFGNGEMQDLAQIRLKLSAHTSAILLSVNLCSLRSQGRVEKRLNDVGGDLEGIRGKVNWIAANMSARSGDGSVWSSYTNDDKGFWRELRRGLVQEGYRSSVLHRHKHLIKQYVEELGERGVFDESDETEAEAPREVDGENSLPVDNSNSEDNEEITQLDDAKLKVQLPNSDFGEDEGIKKGNSQKAARNFQRNVDPEFFALGDNAGSTDSLPEDAEVLDSRLSPPQSPRTSKYLRFDKQIHVGIIDPRARKARTPEEQEAHDKRKEVRKARTPEQQAAHEKRKEEHRGKRKAPVIHTAQQSSSEDRFVSESSVGKHVQMEEVTDEEFSPTSCGDNLDESGSGLDIQTDLGHSKKNSQSSTSDSTNSEYSDLPKDSTDDTTRSTDGLAAENIASLQVESKSEIHAEKVGEDEHIENLLPLPPRCEIINLKDAEFKYALDLVFEPVDILHYEVREGHYDIVGPKGEIILPQIWEDLIQPDWQVSMHMWPKPENSTEVRKQHPPLKRIDLDKDDEKFESDNQVINFKDAVGRKFTLPFYKVRTWKGMKGLINQAFKSVEIIGPAVERGFYDLMGPGSLLIIPEFWKELIQPGWNITMTLWPLPEPRLLLDDSAKTSNLFEGQMRNTPGTSHRHRRGIGSFLDGTGPKLPPPGPPPPLPPGWNWPPLPPAGWVGSQSRQPRGPIPSLISTVGPGASLVAAQSGSNTANPSSSSQAWPESVTIIDPYVEKKMRKLAQGEQPGRLGSWAQGKQPGILGWMAGKSKKESPAKK